MFWRSCYRARRRRCHHLVLAGAGAAGLVALPAGADATACTTVCFTDAAAPIVAYNYDFYSGDGLVLVNPRGLTKTSVVRGNPHTWVARFESPTRRGRLGLGQVCPPPQAAFHSPPQWTHLPSELAARERPVADPIPPRKHDLRVSQ